MPPLTLLLIFGGAAASAAAIASLIFDHFMRDRLSVNERLAERLSPARQRHGKRSPLFRDLKTLQAQTRLGHVALQQRVALLLEQSGLSLTLPQLLAASLVCGVTGLLAVGFLAPMWWLAPLGGLLGLVCPLGLVEMRRRSRISKLCHQLPDAFDQMKRAMRAGQSITGAMQVVAADMQPPLSSEFATCCKQQELGLPLQTCLQDLSRRTGVMELQIFAVALVVQRESGGNCLELFTNLADLVRKRIRLVARVKALTSEGRMQAIVLALLPILGFLTIYFLDRDYIQPLLDRPYVLLGLAASEILGVLWIRKIVNVQY